MPESTYKEIIDKFLSNRTSVDAFIDAYFQLWRADRDSGTMEAYDDRFQRLINRVFTSCDCYAEIPEQSHEVSEIELRNELALLRHIWWE